ncbi:MAG: DUF726 domain-containing protein [Planctomycetes bacterium]|jgi:hypothetical protein|nr:DUF726 domain-containing protein [Planctomycetota bacterium]MBT4560258.1 DUF726 domain-containing protein [Planctomycetota bacterium]
MAQVKKIIKRTKKAGKGDTVTAFCSWCYQKGKHDLHDTNWHTKNEYVCRNCECFVVECTACKNMAKGRLTDKQVAQLKKQVGKKGKRRLSALGDNWKNEFCAQHDGTVSDFKELTKRVARLDQYPDSFKPQHTNFKKVGTITAGVITSAGVLAITAASVGTAPAVAAVAGKLGVLGAAGTGTAISTLSGAALTSASLAAIGGTVASGTVILTAAGAGLGGVAGGVLTNKYVGEDKYFGIQNIRRGGTPKTVFINGFLQQKDVEFNDWMTGHRPCFPEETLYGVTWASKDLYELGRTLGAGIGTEVAKRLLRRIAKKSTTKFNPLGPVITAFGVAKNPWHVSMFRAAKIGVILADVVSRSREKSYTLVGHSLGCRVIYYALQALSSKDKSKINDVIFLGGAVGKDDPAGWEIATKAINGNIYNCYSKHDGVLSKLYRIANANLSHPIGISPIPGRNSKIKNIDCSAFILGVKAHLMWKEHYEDILRRIYK